jgi:uncharacterized protein YndB with AHSA1/START domain
MAKIKITVETEISQPVDKVWNCFTEAQHITEWNSASDDWHTPSAENDLRVGGSFKFRMEAKDKSMGFDLTGTYDEVVPKKWISYTLADGRKVEVNFADEGDGETYLTETFEAESVNPPEKQRAGWQAILDNFKKYVEND